MDQDNHSSEKRLARQRSNARRTALGLAAIAAFIFVMFFLTGVFGTGSAG